MTEKKGLITGVQLFLFAALFLYLFLYVKPELIYSSNGLELKSTFLSASCQKAFSPAVSIPDHFILELTPAYYKQLLKTPGSLDRFFITLLMSHISSLLSIV